MDQHRHGGRLLRVVGDFGDTGCVGEHRDSPAGHGVSDIAGAVGRPTGESGEQVTRLGVLAAQRDPGDGQIRDFGALGDYRAYLGGQRR
jgi:hypothetical protein